MDKLEALYDFANERSIYVIDRSFSQTKKAACLHVKPIKAVVLDKPAIGSKAEEGALLAEEVGHYETGALYVIESTYNTPIARSNRIKYEAQALRWAIKQYLPLSDIRKGLAINDGDIWLTAEYCHVPPDFLTKAIEYYQSHGINFDHAEDEYSEDHVDTNHDNIEIEVPCVDVQTEPEQTNNIDVSICVSDDKNQEAIRKHCKKMAAYYRRRSKLAKELLDIYQTAAEMGMRPRKRTWADEDFALYIDGLRNGHDYSEAISSYRTHEYYYS